MALVLNADFRPLSYFPLSLWCWQDAVKAVFLDRVSIVHEYETVVRSPSFEMRLPSVIALKEYVEASRKPAFTRFNVFLRDLERTRVVSCTEAAWRFLGLSLAGWNVLISLGLSGLAFAGGRAAGARSL